MTVSRIRWEWDPDKARRNFEKHCVPFELAKVALECDLFHRSRIDLDSHEVRFVTLARVENVILVIVHTEPETERYSGDWVGRIISARKAKPSERRAYSYE